MNTFLSVAVVIALTLAVVGFRLWRDQRSAPSADIQVGSGGTDWTDPADYDEHHAVVWRQDPHRFAEGPHHRLLGVTAVFGICTDEPWDRLALDNHDDISSGLAEAWGVRSRPQLLSTIYSLLREGHRVGFVAETAGQPPAILDDEDRWRLEQVRNNSRDIRSVRFEAWDLVRAAMLTRAGYSLGWLNDDEALDTLALISVELQRNYGSWREMGEHFHRARWYWSSNGGLTSRQEDAHDTSRQAALLAPVTGPWSHLDWSQPIPETQFLLIDAMLDEGLITGPPATSPTELAAVLDEVAAQRQNGRQ